jgi:hypothetical protein
VELRGPAWETSTSSAACAISAWRTVGNGTCTCLCSSRGSSTRIKGGALALEYACAGSRVVERTVCATSLRKKSDSQAPNTLISQSGRVCVIGQCGVRGGQGGKVLWALEQHNDGLRVCMGVHRSERCQSSMHMSYGLVVKACAVGANRVRRQTGKEELHTACMCERKWRGRGKMYGPAWRCRAETHAA